MVDGLTPGIATGCQLNRAKGSILGQDCEKFAITKLLLRDLG
jgi:hypothetical protein